MHFYASVYLLREKNVIIYIHRKTALRLRIEAVNRYGLFGLPPCLRCQNGRMKVSRSKWRDECIEGLTQKQGPEDSVFHFCLFVGRAVILRDKSITLLLKISEGQEFQRWFWDPFKDSNAQETLLRLPCLGKRRQETLFLSNKKGLFTLSEEAMNETTEHPR